MPEIKIMQDGPCVTRVFIDGQEIHGIRKMSFERDATQSEIPILKLDLVATNLTVDSPMLLELPDVYKGWYEKKKTVASAKTEAADVSD